MVEWNQGSVKILFISSVVFSSFKEFYFFYLKYLQKPVAMLYSSTGKNI